MIRSHHPDPFLRDLSDRVLAGIRDEVSEGDTADCEPEDRYWRCVAVRHGDLLLALIDSEAEVFVPKVRAAFTRGETDVDVDTEAGLARVVARISVAVRIDWIDTELRTEKVKAT